MATPVDPAVVPPSKPTFGSPAAGPEAPPAGLYAPLPGREEGYDPEAAAFAALATEFADKKVRADFVRKVLGIVLVQLLVTAACGVAFYYVHPLREFVQYNVWPFWLAWIFSFAMLMWMTCSNTARRQYPTNVITLALFTLSFGFLVGVITSFYEAQVLAVALVITAGVVGTVFLLSLTSVDFTRYAGVLVVLGSAFFITALVGLFWVNRTLYLVIGFAGAVLFSLYLLFDLQILMGGRTISISPDDYIFAAVHIYLDIINIFLSVLQILSLQRQ